MTSSDNERGTVSGTRGRVGSFAKMMLALLAGLTLFIAGGSGSISGIFGDSNGGSGDSGDGRYEDQAVRIERKLLKSSKDPALLLALATARLHAGNELIEGKSKDSATEAVQQYRQASDSWSEYLGATSEPNIGAAKAIAPMFITLAEASHGIPEFEAEMLIAAEAAEIVANRDPSINSTVSLAYYRYFAFDKKAAETAGAKAVGLAGSQPEREKIERTLSEYEQRAGEVKTQLKTISQELGIGGAG